ncbi:probable LRR receptor-like serine/threonine-protein kinase At3g47570 isoform X2 [Prosopis cineraria]|uniref:probable LRR receptor-like serine/threonine-protein kinase At3g47570 isoform X2 n=1 Tax=Prosopis cineraria TaxID=364024 RepID=UPI0024109782|nr:probable LRR receptor-like serine/threonine-protein kinase At3g47570 isoform X2 [Prosopis cineraria]
MRLHLLLFFILIFQSCRSVSPRRNETDRLCLLKFKESISNDPYHVLDSWNASTHFCNWHGITCGHKHQRVATFELEGYQLHGSISPSIGNLSFLRIIKLGNNSFHGQIPQELGRLFRLQVLDLTRNTLTGEFPVNVTSCSDLKYLSFGRNNLTGKIPVEISSLHKLEELYLHNNNLNGQIPVSMYNLSSLAFLFMMNNNLEGSIPEEIGHMKSLETFQVHSNKLSGAFPSSLYNLSSLVEIAVSNNQFHCSLPASMFNTLPSFKYLILGLNQFYGPIPTSIVNASKLQIISIPDNDFTGSVPNLGKLLDLWSLGLAGNNLGSNSAKDLEFLESLVNCSKLEELDMQDNNFGGHLPNTIGNLSTQLRILSLGINQISGKIPASLGNLIDLSVLATNHNHLTGNIPFTFGKFQKMQFLSLSGNKLSGEIVPFIGNFTQLFHLTLSDNILEGQIPPTIGNCKKLQLLDLSLNKFSRAIPEEIFGLSSLSILLNLSHNSLSGNISSDVGKLTNIGNLDFSCNNLSGNIPETIGDCASLEYILLQGNFFQETIPSSLASLKGLRYLDFSRNNLSGSIPKDLQGLSDLEYLNVSFNMLDGEVPKKGVFSNASAISLIGNSELCGGISELKLPPCRVNDEVERKHLNFRLVVILCCVVAFSLILSSIVVIHYKKKRSKKSSLSSHTVGLLPKVSYQSLHNATDGFSTSNLIGSGRFGFVYKGSLETHEVVAIKVLNLHVKGAHKSFMAECNSLKNRRHRNLAKILTCCSSTDYKGHDFKALVYEYMVNGNLENWLHPSIENQSHQRILLLDQILNILIDVASALHYLHHECEQPLVHCDLKPSNVLLDSNMVAHVSDFGLARLLSTSKGISNEQSSTIGIKGTIGYIPRVMSMQGDMYSFGILVLEMLTKRRPTEDMFKDGHNLHRYVEIAFPEKLLQVVSPSILPREPGHGEATSEDIWESMIQIHPDIEKCLCSLSRIGLVCSTESPHERMSAGDVIKELNAMRSYFPLC